MFGSIDKFIAVFLTGFVTTYLLTPSVRALALRYGVVDMPDERRPHKRPTARGGGLALVLGVHAACLMAYTFPWPKGAAGFDFHWWERFAAASLILLIVGLVDDVRGLSPRIKLGGQVLAALLVSFSGTRFGTLFGMKLPFWLDCLFVVVWLVAVINAFNLIDGLDGLASGLAIISALGLCGVILLQHLPGIMVILGLIAACLAFLRYNFHPATIFLGDTGSMFLGFTLGVVSLQTFTKSTFFLSLSIPLLVLGVPIYDALLAIWRRSVRSWLKGNEPGGNFRLMGIMQPDIDHLHHRLLKAGLSTRRVATVLCVGNAALVIFGLLMTSFKWHASGIFLIALLAGAYVVMRHLALIELRDTGTALLHGLRRPSNSALKALAYPIWDMFWLCGALAAAMWLTEPGKVDFWHSWFLDLPVWVTPTFSLLAISRTYLTVWTRARMRDVFTLALTLQLGLFFSLGLALLIDPYNESGKWLVRALLVAGLSHPAIIGCRVAYRFIEEVVNWSRSKNDRTGDERRVVLYGAGGRCWLFLRERGLNSANFDGRVIVGLIDDEPALLSRWIYGYQVLGGRTDLPVLVSRKRLTGIIITALLSPESRAAVKQLAAQQGLQLTEWRCAEESAETEIEYPKHMWNSI